MSFIPARPALLRTQPIAPDLFNGGHSPSESASSETQRFRNHEQGCHFVELNTRASVIWLTFFLNFLYTVTTLMRLNPNIPHKLMQRIQITTTNQQLLHYVTVSVTPDNIVSWRHGINVVNPPHPQPVKLGYWPHGCDVILRH